VDEEVARMEVVVEVRKRRQRCGGLDEVGATGSAPRRWQWSRRGERRPHVRRRG
jgi:hypothetical protein